MAYLDGELPFYARSAVPRHLQECWECRLRLDEFERQVLEVTRAIREDTFPGPQRKIDAQLAFLARADAIAAEAPAVAAHRRRRAPWALGAAAAGLALLGGIWWAAKPPGQPALPGPLDVMGRAETAETPPVGEPVHQRFRLTARQTRPVTVNHESRLELWCEPARGRFASRLEAPGGILRHAVWQPEPSRRYVYNPRRAMRIVQVSSGGQRDRWGAVLFQADLNLEKLEEVLLQWLEGRQWKPLSLSAEMTYFAGQEQAALLLERLPETSGGNRLKLFASKRMGDVAVQFTLILGEREYRPQLQSIRYESPARVLELVFEPENPAVVPAVSFEPPVSLPSPARDHVITQPPVRLAPLLPKPDPDESEIEVWYALHRTGACLGEPVEVLRQADQTLLVRGVVATPERREQLQAALAQSGRGSLLHVAIQTAQDVWPEVSAESIAGPPPRHGRQQSGRLYLEKYFTQGFKDPSQAAARFADSALSRSDLLMAEAWALRHLSERFGNGPPQADGHPLVEAMVRDHLLRLRAITENSREFLASVLPDAPVGNSLRPEPVDCWEGIRNVFESTANLNKAMLELCAAGPDTPSPERLVGQVFAGLRSIGLEARRVSTRLASSLPPDGAGPSRTPPR